MSYLENMYLKQRQGVCQGRGLSGGGQSRGGGQSGGGQSGGGLSGGGLSGGGQCVASTPATTVQIQPPPFVLSIPGPTLVAASQPLSIQQHNPCASLGGRGGRGGGGSGGGGGGGSGGGRKSFFFEEYPSELMLESGMGPYCGYYSHMDLPYYY